MTSIHDESQFLAMYWQRLQLESERQRLIEGIKLLPTSKRDHFAPWIELLELEPEQYPRLKRDMERIGFDLQALMAPMEAVTPAKMELSPLAAWEVVIRLSPVPANDGGSVARYRQAANFSTSGQVEVEPTWHGAGAIGDDRFEITAQPDPLKKRVQLAIWFDAPKSLAAGSVLFVTLPGQENSGIPFAVKLRALERRIQGELSVSMAWTEFVDHIQKGVIVSTRSHSPS